MTGNSCHPKAALYPVEIFFLLLNQNILWHISCLAVCDWDSSSKSRRQGETGRLRWKGNTRLLSLGDLAPLEAWPRRPPSSHRNPEVSAAQLRLEAGDGQWAQLFSAAHPTFSGSSGLCGGRGRLWATGHGLLRGGASEPDVPTPTKSSPDSHHLSHWDLWATWNSSDAAAPSNTQGFTHVSTCLPVRA